MPWCDYHTPGGLKDLIYIYIYVYIYIYIYIYIITPPSVYLRIDIDKIESVQRFFTRKLFQRTGNSSQGYEDRLNKLRLKSLEERRIMFDLIMVYKIVYSLVDLNFGDFFQFRESSYSLRGHSLTLIKSKTKTPIAANFFCNRVVSVWNKLPEQVVRARSVTSFKFKIKKMNLVELKKGHC